MSTGHLDHATGQDIQGLIVVVVFPDQTTGAGRLTMLHESGGGLEAFKAARAATTTTTTIGQLASHDDRSWFGEDRLDFLLGMRIRSKMSFEGGHSQKGSPASDWSSVSVLVPYRTHTRNNPSGLD